MKKVSAYRSTLKKQKKIRFSSKSKNFFDFLKKDTRYNQYMKRDGGVTDKCYDKDGTILTGDRMHEKILSHYEEIHSINKNVAEVKFPKLDVS